MSSIHSAEKLVIVGWDGATYDLILPWVEQGLLPNTAKLLGRGAHRVLNSTIPTLSPPAWTSFYTGKNPGRHGTFDFVRRKPDSYELQSHRNDLPALGTLFHWVSEAGKRVGAINVPFTYPPEAVNGFMIAGLSADRNWEFTHPPELKPYLLRKEYQIDNPIHYEPGNDEAYAEVALATTRTRAAVTLELMRTQPWDMFMVVFVNIDQMLSFLWHHMDPTHPRHTPALAHLGKTILELHQILDQTLGEMMAIAGDDATIIVASDHGMGPLYKEVFLNNWLAQQGYLQRMAANPVQSNYNQIMRRLGVTREGLWRRLGRARTQRLKALLPKPLHRFIPTETPSLVEQIDWAQTRAYSFGNVGQIYINLAGREPQGIVQPGAEYDRLVEEICRNLAELRDPETNEKVVDAIYRKQELYDGPHMAAAPDINVIMRNYSYITQMRRELATRQIFAPLEQMSGFHRREGVFMVAGPQIAPGDYAPASIVDVTPTVLYLMGLPIPDDMDGQVMLDLCQAAYKDGNPPQQTAAPHYTESSSALSAEDEEKTLQRLRDLGYLG